MKQDNNQVISLIKSAQSILAKISIDYNSVIGPNTRKLVETTKQITPLIIMDYPDIANVLKNATNNIVTKQTLQTYPYGTIVVKDFINAYSFGDIRTAIKILDSLYSSKPSQSHKLFISHSSKDKAIVMDFSDHILQLGIGIDAQDIFCTSIEDLGIKNGNDIREHIRKNIQASDFSLLMISNKYKQSEICLNEMGAVWAYNNQVRYYLLPNTNFDSIGWLCNPNRADFIDNPITLDALHNELIEFYKLPDNGIKWSRHRQTFLEKTAQYNNPENKSPQTNVQSPSNTNIEDNILNLLKNRPNSTINEIAETIGVSTKAVTHHLSKLLSENKIIREGSPRVKKYRLV